MTTTIPEATGRFGAFGGRYVPETLIPALDELERAYDAAMADPDVRAEFDRTCSRLRRPSVAAERRAALLRARRRASLAQARRPEPHGRAQDQQHGRPGAARAAHGQAAHHRRDRRRAARRRDGDGLRAIRSGVRRVHGREDMRRQELNVFRMRLMGATVIPCSIGNAHAQGRDDGSDSRLGHERRHDALHHRLGGGAGAVSAHGARLPVGDRPRGARADASAHGRCRRRSSRASAAAPTRWACSTRSSTMRASSSSASRRRARGSTPSITPRRCRAGGRACCTAR